MKESEFIEQNKKKWLEFEENIDKKEYSPSKTSSLFIQISDDLSYARTFYPNRSVKTYLNGVSKALLNDINRSDKSHYAGFINFWRKGLPTAIYASRRVMLISFLVFVAAFTLGVITSMYDPDFAIEILGSEYVSMTQKNIQKGDPMAVYKSNTELGTFLPIFWNNFRVDMLTFLSGLLAAIGTLMVMVYNGVMVGVFQYFFIERDVFWPSFLGIWTHGALEISSIVISGGAGMMLGRGLLFPGTYTRFQAFRMNAMHGLKIILGVLPITLTAAFIEGFMTRHTEIHDGLRLLFIMLSFTFIILYFYYYPKVLHKRRGSAADAEEDTPLYSPKKSFNILEVLKLNQLIAETLRQVSKNLLFFVLCALGLSLFTALVIANENLNLFHLANTNFYSYTDFFSFVDYPGAAIVNWLLILGAVVLVMDKCRKTIGRDQEITLKKSALDAKVLFSVGLSATLFVSIIFMDSGWFIALAFILFPFLLLTSIISLKQNRSFFKSLNLLGGMLNKQLMTFVLVSVSAFLCSLLLFFSIRILINVLLVKEAVVTVFTNNYMMANSIYLGISVMEVVFSFVFYIVLSTVANYVMYFTLYETYTANNLIYRIKNIHLSH